ncbi:MAG: DUF3179 domain-containing (seleno)protein [Methyloligellaceae bacterium]
MDMRFFVNLVLFLVGAGALLHAYLAFSPMTRDLVAFLSRDAQINIFKHRRIYWTIGAACLAALLVRSLMGVTASGGAADWFWLVIGGLTALGLSLLYWAMYVPVVMAPPVTHHLVTIDEADQILQPESVVLGLEMGDEVRAYPRDLIARPHWFNDELGGKPLMISYCILCNSGQAFVPILKDGRRLDLRNMTAFDNNTIYHCTKTGNFIQQLDARVIRGPNEGEVLESYPVVMARWEEWKRLHPSTKMYYAPPITLRDRIVQKLLMTMVPLSRLAARDEPWHVVRSEIDGRLPAMSFVFGVEIDGDTCAYPLSALKNEPVVNDNVGGQAVVVLYDAKHDIGQVFRRRVGDQTLTFSNATPDAGPSLVAKDAETGTTWSVSGHAIDGELAGHRLEPAPHWNQLFWFSWAAFKPNTRIYADAQKDAPAAAAE